MSVPLIAVTQVNKRKITFESIQMDPLSVFSRMHHWDPTRTPGLLGLAGA